MNRIEIQKLDRCKPEYMIKIFDLKKSKNDKSLSKFVVFCSEINMTTEQFSIGMLCNLAF